MNYEKIITILLSQTETMFSLAEKGDWDTLAERETERQCYIQQLTRFNPTEKTPELVNQLQQLIDINTQIEQLGRKAMRQCFDERNDVKRKRSALMAYSQ